MKILYLCTYFHEAMLYRQQMDALIARGHDVRVFNSATYGAPIIEKMQKVMDERVKHVECWRPLDRKLFFPRQWKIESAFRKAYDPKAFDLMHAHLMLTTGWMARKAKKRTGVPYVVSVRVTDLIGWIRLPFFRKVALRNVQEASGILFLAKAHQDTFFNRFVPEECREELMKKSVVIGNCLEKFWEEHTAAEAKQIKDPKEVKILLVGRITKFKNIPLACKAVEILRNRGVNAALTVIGAVEDQEEADQIQKYGFVTIKPFMRSDELIEEYRQHDLFFLPSRVETFGRVYVEAMSQGLPVIYTRGQGFDGIYEEGTVGFSVDADDPEEMAEKMGMILESHEEISRNCLEKCQDFYEEVIMDKIEHFYQESLNREKNKK